MTQKRFSLSIDTEWWFVQDNTIQVNKYGYRDDLTGEDEYRGLHQELTEQETVDLLNKFYEENKKLHFQFNLLQEPINGFYRGARENANMVEQLKRENKELKLRINDFKHEIHRLKHELKQMAMDTDMVLNNQLKEENKGLKLQLEAFKDKLNELSDENGQLKEENEQSKKKNKRSYYIL